MNSPVKMILTLTIISAIAAGALSAGNILTKDKIKAEAKASATRAVKRIFPNCSSPVEKQLKTDNGKTTTAYICKGGNVSFLYSSKFDSSVSNPYSGEIKIMIGIDSFGKIKGLEIISQSETPGLGARIIEKSFRKQFIGLDKNTKWKVKKDDPSGAIDGLSGATISSRALVTTVASSLKFYSSKIKKFINTNQPNQPNQPKYRYKRKRTRSHRTTSVPLSKIKILNRTPKGFLKAKKMYKEDIKRKREAARRKGQEKNGRPNLELLKKMEKNK